LFLSTEAQTKVEADVRAKYQPEVQKIAKRYNRHEVLLSESVNKILADLGQEDKAEEEKQGKNQTLARSKTQMMAEEDVVDLKAVDMQQILNRAFKYLPADFIVIDLRVEVPALSFSIINEFAQDLLLARVDQIDFNLKKAARAFFNVSLQIQDFHVKDKWSTCAEEGVEDARFEYLARTTDHENEDEEPFGDQSNQGEDKAASIFFELKDSGPPHLEARFKRKLTLYILAPVVMEVQRTLGKALGAGRKMDFRFYRQLASARVRGLRQQVQNIADEIFSNRGSGNATTKKRA